MSRFNLADIHRMAVLRRQVAQLKEAQSKREHEKAEYEVSRLSEEVAAVTARARSTEGLPPGLETEATRRAFRQRLADLRLAIADRRNKAHEVEIEARMVFQQTRIVHARMSVREETIEGKCQLDQRALGRIAETRAYESIVDISVAGQHVRGNHE